MVSWLEALTCSLAADECWATAATSPISRLDPLGPLCDLGDGLGDATGAGVHVLDARAEGGERLSRALRRRRSLADALPAQRHGANGAGRAVLDLGDDRADALGSSPRFVGELANLLGDDGEAAALFAGSRRLDGGVQRQQVGLLGDGGNSVDDPADLPRLGPQRPDGLGGLA